MPKLAELNAVGRSEFTRIVGPVFEHSPWVAARTCMQRPFQTREDLHAALCETVMKASDDEKLALIRAHPDLVGDTHLTAASQAEQASAELDAISPEEVKQFRDYNRQYRERFGFPFVICARQNKKDAMLHAFPIRLQNAPEQEIEIALQEIFKIAELRLLDLMQ